MAFEALRPHQSQILGLVDQGRTLAQIADILAAQHGAATTPGTLSRFITSLRPATKQRPATPPPASPSQQPPLSLTPEQQAQVDAISLFTELLAEIHASRTESRDVCEHLAGKLAGLSADVAELERAVERGQQDMRAQLARVTAAPPAATATMPGNLLVKVWWRALLITGLVWGVIVGIISLY